MIIIIIVFKGADFYMAKYIDKEIDYDIFGLSRRSK